MTLECICREGISPGAYSVGCPFHIDRELRRGPTARPKVGFHTVTYYHAEVRVSTPVLQEGAVWSQETHVTCDHNHVSEEQAARCAVTLARKHAKTVYEVR